MPPFLQRSEIVGVGYALLNAPTAFWQRGGMAVLADGCGPTVLVPGVFGVVGFPGCTLAALPRNAPTGHVNVSSMRQSSTYKVTV
jgi:hypothetical protein